MAAWSRADDRLVEQVARICARAQDPLALFERVASEVCRHIPYEAAGWLLVDPDTLLINGVYEQNVPRDTHLRLIEVELAADDYTKFVDLGRARTPAAALSAATDGRLDRCLRWSQVYEPEGYGDELRTVFRTGAVIWGNACLTRRVEEPWFTPREVGVLAALSPHVAHGIRTGLLLQGGPSEGGGTAIGLVVLDDSGGVEYSSPQAVEWLGPVDDERLEGSVVVYEVAAQARALACAGAGGPPAVARARSRTGEWLLVRGTWVPGRGGRTVIVVEPAARSDVAPVLMHLHELTPREREVTRLLLTGMATVDIARELRITADTLRGHVKNVFAKLGVNSRPELFARLAQEPRVRPTPR